ncbi:phosphoesterase RecJ domain-containing protein [Nakamurella panacisegetis]|uniref:Phosphoesterase RecJ domain-containing protein n=1 Tax=Nakamurella panacisegetis TaxID=1090615 RepID=A0A1H0SJB4_9ACTN|nr:DHH family phosphoesterase [Nakamurella panacisegetis]SDP41871.1 phosphoesterase RecJ domain-containing protein [Nakamurella panacisegetis]
MSSALEVSTDLVRSCALIDAAQSLVLLAHVGPDADALGSALALGLALEAAGRDVCVAFAEPARVPESLRGLPGQHLVTPVERVPVHPDLVVTLDVNSRERLGVLESLLDTASSSLVIDHHASNTRFGHHHLVETAAESTTVLVAAVLDRLGLCIDREIAANIYAGLATDTVGFRFASAAAHRLAARLLDAGVDPDTLMRPITDLHPFAWLGMLAKVLGAAVLDPAAARGRGLVTAVISAEQAVGLRQEELDSVIDILRTAHQADVAAVLKQTGPTQWQVSLRSRAGVDVAHAAGQLGGGGHVRAAGFGFAGTAAAAIAALTMVLATGSS